MHSAPIFPTGHGFQPTASLIGASFGAGSGVVSHPTTSFSVDAYGVPSISERPKKVIFVLLTALNLDITRHAYEILLNFRPLYLIGLGRK